MMVQNAALMKRYDDLLETKVGQYKSHVRNFCNKKLKRESKSESRHPTASRISKPKKSKTGRKSKK